MVAHLLLLSLTSVVLTLTTLHGTGAVRYTVTNNAPNTPGGSRFTKEIGVTYSRSTLDTATRFIWRTFRQTRLADRKNVRSVNMFVDNMDGIAYGGNGEIHVSANYIAGYYGDVRREITGILFHETTHIWQWDGNGQAPEGLIEGIADYVMLKAGYVPSDWVRTGGGDKWDEGYDITAQFLDYCESLRGGFVAELNRKMRKGYNNNFFVKLLGKTVEQLWRDYKVKYGK